VVPGGDDDDDDDDDYDVAAVNHVTEAGRP
jgi:hypothetical protein